MGLAAKGERPAKWRGLAAREWHGFLGRGKGHVASRVIGFAVCAAAFGAVTAGLLEMCGVPHLPLAVALPLGIAPVIAVALARRRGIEIFPEKEKRPLRRFLTMFAIIALGYEGLDAYTGQRVDVIATLVLAAIIAGFFTLIHRPVTPVPPPVSPEAIDEMYRNSRPS